MNFNENFATFHLLHVEIEKSKYSSRPNHDLEVAVRNFLVSIDTVPNGKVFETLEFTNQTLRDHVSKITLFVSNFPADQTFFVRQFLNTAAFYVYQNLHDPPCPEEIEDDEDSTVVGSHHWPLPNAEFEGYWENLIFDINIKEKILNYADSMLRFSDSNVDSTIVTSNKLILFHGPPGTGKTTLCKAVAQKLSIRLSKRYASSQLLEINSHSLFSKWFSESGKLVMKMFDKIRELLEDDKCLVFVLIDEIESLTKARQSSLSSSEPSDAIRVVNALLTQIDYIRRYRNVLILTTSNLTNAVDDAFLDRADIKQYVGPPSDIAIYKILFSCIKELQQKGIIANEYISANPCTSDSTKYECGKFLFEISKKCVGLSGRTLRKLPVIAHAMIGSPNIIDLATFLKGLSLAAKESREDKVEQTVNPVKADVKRIKASNAVVNGVDLLNGETIHWDGSVKDEPLDD